jgi:hypothetical protein
MRIADVFVASVFLVACADSAATAESPRNAGSEDPQRTSEVRGAVEGREVDYSFAFFGTESGGPAPDEVHVLLTNRSDQCTEEERVRRAPVGAPVGDLYANTLGFSASLGANGVLPRVAVEDGNAAEITLANVTVQNGAPVGAQNHPASRVDADVTIVFFGKANERLGTASGHIAASRCAAMDSAR